MKTTFRQLRPTLAFWGLAVAVKFLVGCGSEAHGEEQTRAASTEPPAKPSPSASVAAIPQLATAQPDASADPSILISAVGDCTLGEPAGTERAPGGFHHTAADGDLARPFSLVQAVLGKDDLTIANLETTLTRAAARTDLPFSFRGKPEFAQMLSLGSVDVVSLANNHHGDCGTVGMKDTRESLSAAGVGFFGMGYVDTREIKGIRVHNLGYLGGSEDARNQMVKDVQKHKRPDELVIVSFHWGIEEEHAINNVQQRLGRAAIDAGADLVLGHHPHVLQGIETYKDKKIVYSLGNFVFGGHTHPKDIDSMIYQARFAKRDGVVHFVSDEVVPVWISGVREQNDFRPVLLSGADAQSIKDKVARFTKSLPGQSP